MGHIEAYDFGTLLQQLRKQKRLSQKELASRLGLRSRGTVDAWEQGKQRPQTIERVIAVAEALTLSDYQSEMFFAAYLSPIFEESKVHHHLGSHDCYPDFRLPVHYFRPTPLFSAIRALLTSDIAGTKRRSQLPSTPIALHGMGGIGKSVVARDVESRYVVPPFTVKVSKSRTGQVVNKVKSEPVLTKCERLTPIMSRSMRLLRKPLQKRIVALGSCQFRWEAV